MGLTAVESGDRVIGVGFSPFTGRRISGKFGTVVNITSDSGGEIVHVEWDGDQVDDRVRQDNVSGTRMG